MNKLLLFYKKHIEIINYLIVGMLTTLVSLITYYICVYTVYDPKNPFLLQSANVISWISSVTFAYFTNRIFVFKSNSKKAKEFINFVNSRIITLLLDMGSMFLLVTCLSFDDKISKLIVQVIVIVLNYLLSKILVFKKDNCIN